MSDAALLPLLVNAAGLGAAGLGIAVLVVRQEGWKQTDAVWPLAALLAVLGFDVASSIYDLSPWSSQRPGLVSASYALWPWLPVLLSAYIGRLTRAGAQPHPRWSGQGAVALVASACWAPFLLLGADQRQALADGNATGLAQAVAVIGLLLFILLWLILMIWAAIASARRLSAYRRRLRDLLADVAAVDLRWIDGFALFIGSGLILAVLDMLLLATTGSEVFSTLGAAVFEIIVIVGLVLFGLCQQQDAPGEEPALQPDISEPRYARSALDATTRAAIAQRLEAAMNSDELWRDPLLNLRVLSARVSTRPDYVTQTLNTVLRLNFYDYVNGWRVRAAQTALREGEASILAISEDVGFNSKSTFNGVFRKMTGQTPSAYRRDHRRK